MKIIITGVLCFVGGAVFGMYRAVEVSEDKIVKIVGIIKGIVNFI